MAHDGSRRSREERRIESQADFCDSEHRLTRDKSMLKACLSGYADSVATNRLPATAPTGLEDFWSTTSKIKKTRSTQAHPDESDMHHSSAEVMQAVVAVYSSLHDCLSIVCLESLCRRRGHHCHEQVSACYVRKSSFSHAITDRKEMERATIPVRTSLAAAKLLVDWDNMAFATDDHASRTSRSSRVRVSSRGHTLRRTPSSLHSHAT